jgi:hypothetical protein
MSDTPWGTTLLAFEQALFRPKAYPTTRAKREEEASLVFQDQQPRAGAPRTKRCELGSARAPAPGVPRAKCSRKRNA